MKEVNAPGVVAFPLGPECTATTRNPNTESGVSPASIADTTCAFAVELNVCVPVLTSTPEPTSPYWKK